MSAAQGNPRIAPTAHFTAQIWHRAGFANAAQFDTPVGRLGYRTWQGLRLPLGLMSPAATHLVDFLCLRHQWLDQRLRALNPGLVFEVGAGLSGRGLTLAAERPALCYIDIDLPAVVASKRARLSKQICPPNYQLQALDLLDSEFAAQAMALAAAARGPCVVITEGVCDYLDFDAKRLAWRHIAELLRVAGGGHYLLEMHPRSALRLFGPPAAAVLELLGWVTASDFRQRLYPTVEEGVAELASCGFAEVEILDPDTLDAGRFQVPPQGRFFDLLEARHS
ncbi:MAG: class I SAM-dependent methyltransferase [Salinisphaera sp.]|nr:class I SAM-dependent methyltransferase [Salinisphaera sp.]